MLENMRRTKSMLLSAAIVWVATSSMNVNAETVWQKQHPRRAEVNARLANQNHRIQREVREGELTHAQAQGLHQQDRAIRQEERDMAGLNGGHITRVEKRALNQQESVVSREIGR